MPFYEFECKNCKKIVEELWGINDTSTPVCECGSTTHKIISSPANMRHNWSNWNGNDGGGRVI